MDEGGRIGHTEVTYITYTSTPTDQMSVAKETGRSSITSGAAADKSRVETKVENYRLDHPALQHSGSNSESVLQR